MDGGVAKGVVYVCTVLDYCFLWVLAVLSHVGYDEVLSAWSCVEVG